MSPSTTPSCSRSSAPTSSSPAARCCARCSSARSTAARSAKGLDLELLLDLFAGPAVYRLLITGGDMTQMFSVDEQMDALMNGLAP